MGDLISSSRLKAELESWAVCVNNPQYYHKEDADFAIDSQAAVDAVEVVRCKDCVHSRELDKYEKQLYLPECVGCTKHSKSYSSVVMMGDDFCSYGERKEK